ncbi:MAG: hypothetical protein AAFP77_15095 [Bacteroidota bacterium]
MKQLALITLILGLSVFTSYAQRLDDHRFNHEYLQLPKEPLAADFQTYAVQFNPGTVNLAKMGMVEASLIKNYFSFANYDYAPEAGDFLLEVNLDGDFFVSKEAKKKQKTEGRGDDAKTVTYYQYLVKFRIPITYRVLDGKREIVADKIFSGYDRTFTKEFGEASSVTRLERAWENSGQASLDSWVKAEFANQMAAFQRHLQSNYDTRPATYTPIFYGIKKADKIGYEDMAAAVPALKSVVEGATVEAPLTMDAFGNNISLWEGALANAKADDKKESVAFQAAAYNMAQAYLITSNYAGAREMANRIAEAGRREWLQRAIMPLIDDQEARYQANQNVEARFHATFDADSHAAYMAQQNATNAPVAAAPAEDLSGFVVLKNGQDTLFGVITYDYKEIKGSDGAKNFKGLYVEDRANPDKAKRYLETEEFLFVKRGDVRLFPVRISFGPISLMTLQEPIYGTDGLILNRLNEGEGDYSYWLVHGARNRKGETVRKVYGIEEGLAFLNLNRTLANKFEDYCSTIVSKANEGTYESNETSYRMIIDDYASCNGTETFDQ